MKKLGFIHDYDIKNLTKNQKDHITKQYRQYSFLLSRPQDFVSATISNKRASKIAGAAYKIRIGKKTRVYYKGDEVKVGRTSITLKDGPFVDRIFDRSTPHDIFKQAEKHFKKLKDGQSLTVAIGKNTRFQRSFGDMRAFERYMHAWIPKDCVDNDKDDDDEEVDHKQMLMDHMRIVEVIKTSSGKMTKERYGREKAATKNRRRL